MKILTKTLMAVAILFGGPLLGILIAILYAGFVSDPNLISKSTHSSPGDGILGVLCIFASLIIFVPASVLLAAVVLLRKPKSQDQIPM